MPTAVTRNATMLALLATAGCSSASSVAPSVEQSPSLTAYYIQPVLCQDAAGLDCTKLRLGDTHLTTTTPARGAMFACAQQITC